MSSAKWRLFRLGLNELTEIATAFTTRSLLLLPYIEAVSAGHMIDNTICFPEFSSRIHS